MQCVPLSCCMCEFKWSSESAKKDIGEEAAEADVHHISPTLPTEDRAPKPNTYKCTIEDIRDGVTEADPEDIHHIGTTLTTGNTAFKPDTDESVTNPIDTTTSKVWITLLQKTRMAREMIVVVTDGPGVEGCNVSP